MEGIRTIRSQLGLTQAEFADKLGLHQSTISRLETGEMEIDKRTRLAVQALVTDSVGATPSAPDSDAERESSPDDDGAGIGADDPIAAEGTAAASADDRGGPSGRAPGGEAERSVSPPSVSAPGDLFAAERVRGAA